MSDLHRIKPPHGISIRCPNPKCGSENVHANEVFCSWEVHIPKEDRPRHFYCYCRVPGCIGTFVHDWYPGREDGEVKD